MRVDRVVVVIVCVMGHRVSFSARAGCPGGGYIMRIISWNIQWGRGADGRVDLSRTIDALRALGPAELIGLQEVARGFPSLSGEDDDGVARLAAAFPEHEAVFAPAVDAPGERGGRGQFGNLLLSSLPVLQVIRHALPFPADGRVPNMPRSCLEAVVEAPSGPLRVLVTHLEYYSAPQRQAQVDALRALQREAMTHAGVVARGKESSPVFAARPRPERAVLWGDFNMEAGSEDYRRMADGDSPWRDAWTLAHGDAPHAPSVGLHGAGWPDRPYCCDYFWVSESLAANVGDVRVDAATAASDHQPLVLELG